MSSEVEGSQYICFKLVLDFVDAEIGTTLLAMDVVIAVVRAVVVVQLAMT